MENIQPLPTPPLSPFSSPSQPQAMSSNITKTNTPKFFLFILLGLVILSGTFYSGYLIGKGNSSTNKQAATAKSCVYQGVTYNPEDSFPAADGCNQCSCGPNGEAVCTLMACGGEIPTTEQETTSETPQVIQNSDIVPGLPEETPPGTEVQQFTDI